MKAPRLTNGANGNSGQWNALHDDAQGSATLLAHQQSGFYSLGTNPSNGQTITFTINSTAVVLTGRTGSISAAGDFKIGATIAITLATIMNQLQNPWATNATQIALTLGNQQLLSFLGFALSGTKITAYSLNTTLNSQLSTFNGSTTFTSGSYTVSSQAVFVEPGIFYIGTAQVKFPGGSSPNVTPPGTNPRIDLLTIDTSGTLAWTTGTESASPVAPAYPFGKVPICEITNVVGESAILDNANQSGAQGVISADVRPFNNIQYINDQNQIADGIITAAKLAMAGVIITGDIIMTGSRIAGAGFLLCDGSAASRTTFSALFAAIAPPLGTFTVTIASPAVFTLASHGLAAGDAVYFTTTGALPTGLSANTIYFVISAGLTTNAFEVSAARGGSAINTTGSQSGTHTAVFCPYGLGDGSTTFNVPDLRGNVAVGKNTGTFANLGKTGGEETHQLTQAEMASHTHNVTKSNVANTASGTSIAMGTGPSGTTTEPTSSVGSDTPHNNIQPYNVVNYKIKT
jgi:microcystin-dependent protein